jgi:hypothetical protein
MESSVPSARVLTGLALLVASAFFVAFLIGRAFRGEDGPDLRAPPGVAPATPRLSPLGPTAVLPPLRPRPAKRHG